MMKEAIEKGHYGYIDRRKKNQLIKTLICAVVIVFLAGLGYMIFGTKLNFIMVPIFSSLSLDSPPLIRLPQSTMRQSGHMMSRECCSPIW